MHVFEAALYFVYYIILLLDITTKPNDLWWQSARQSLPKTSNNSHKHIFDGSLASDKYKMSSFWVS